MFWSRLLLLDWLGHVGWAHGPGQWRLRLVALEVQIKCAAVAGHAIAAKSKFRVLIDKSRLGIRIVGDHIGFDAANVVSQMVSQIHEVPGLV